MSQAAGPGPAPADVERLDYYLGTPLVELPGNHAGMIEHPAQFAARLRSLLRQPVPHGAGDDEANSEVTT